jgi:hypothetical protein
LASFSVWRCSGILVASETQHDARRAPLELRFRRKNRGRWPAWHFEGAGIVEAGFFQPALDFVEAESFTFYVFMSIRAAIINEGSGALLR